MTCYPEKFLSGRGGDAAAADRLDGEPASSPRRLKALTLWQPWASLIAYGAKTVETRSWGTAYRGPIAIHAAQRPPELEFEPRAKRLIRETLAYHGREDLAMLPRGRVVAIAELVDCEPAEVWLKRMRASVPATLRRIHVERLLGGLGPGRFAWSLAKVRRFLVPVPARGAQGLWEWDPTERELALGQLTEALS